MSDKRDEPGPWEIWCDNAKSFNLVKHHGTKGWKTEILVRCNREDPEDNNRGLRIAKLIEAAPGLLANLKNRVHQCCGSGRTPFCLRCVSSLTAISKAEEVTS